MKPNASKAKASALGATRVASGGAGAGPAFKRLFVQRHGAATWAQVRAPVDEAVAHLTELVKDKLELTTPLDSITLHTADVDRAGKVLSVAEAALPVRSTVAEAVLGDSIVVKESTAASASGGASGGASSRALTVADVESIAAAATRATLRALGTPSAALSPPTASLLGNVTLDELSTTAAVHDLAAAAGAAVLDPEEQDRLSDLTTENDVIKFITPFLMDICTPASTAAGASSFRRVLVNSEYLQWLRHPASKREKLELKPDLHLSWHPFVEYRDANDTQSPAGPGFLFGILPSDALTKAMCSVAFFEAKRGPLTHKDFGELCAYHQCINGPCWGMLFDATAFWLYTSVRGNPVRLLRGKWVQPGSAAAIRDHFNAVPEPALLTLLKALTSALAVDICQYAPARRAHLGSGANGHVFSVGDPFRPKALKVILQPDDGTSIATEFALMADAADRCADAVVCPVPGSLREFDSLGPASGGGYMLAEVGEPIDLKTAKHCAKVFAALARLHRGRVYHGDARLPNLVAVRDADGQKQLKWVDLRHCSMLRETESAEVQCRRDLCTLAASILDCAGELPREVQAAIGRYVPGGEVEDVSAAVWAAKLSAPAGRLRV